MQQTTRIRTSIAFVAVISALLSVSLPAQPTPTPTGHPSAPSPVPGGSGPVILKSGTPAPMGMPLAQGITAEEFKTYTTFQQRTNEDPAIKEINAKIEQLTKEVQRLRAEANVVREKLMAANPTVKKIQEKIMAAMPSRVPNGAGPMPMPAKTQ